MASRDSISFQNISTEHGLPQSTVNIIFQDSHGFMWFGTFDGLSRYDGYQFVNFKNDPNNPSSLSNNIVVSIIEDHEGFLWIGTAQNGVNRFDPKTGIFQRFVSKNSDFDSLSHDQVNIIHQDQKNRVWIGTDLGLNLYLPDKQAFAHFYNNPLDSKSLPSGSVVDITNDEDGNLWIATTEALAHFDVEQQIFKRFDREEMPTQINTIYKDSDHSLWVGTQFDGLYRLPPNEETFEHLNHIKGDDGSLSFNDVRDILRSSNGNLWIATEEGGLNVRKKGEENFSAFTRNSSDPHSISINDIWSLFEDKSGLLWIGTAGGGINTTQPFNSQFSRLTHSPYEKNGLSHDFVWDIEEDQQGNIWLGTLNGFDIFNPRTNQFTQLQSFKTQQNIPIGNRIQAFTFDDQENLWFGNQQGQLAVYSPKTQSTELITRDKFNHGYVSYNRIRMIDKDRFGQIWVGTDDGLLKVDAERKAILKDFQFAEKGQLGHSTVRTMLQDKTGDIWFGTWDGGLQKYDPEFDSVENFKNEIGNPKSLSNNTVRSLFFDNEDNLWVGTFNGLNKMSAQNIASNINEFESYLESDGLSNSAIYGIVSDTSGMLWLSTNNGLSKFDPTSKIFSNYSIQDGLPANEFNGNAVLRSQSDELYFGGVNGVAIVNPSMSIHQSFEPDTVLTSLQVLGRRVKPAGVLMENTPLEFAYDQNDFVFEFAALDYRFVNRNKFRYKLSPYNTEWVSADQRHQAVFTNLDPNSYVFELQATNGVGEWSSRKSYFQITILPPIWNTWWAKILYLLAFVGLLIYFVKRHRKSLEEHQKINQHLRRVDQLKDEFLANTSHELRTPLNGIIGIAESLKEGVAGIQSEKTIGHLSLIIDGGKRLAQLVNDILDFKKLNHHTMILQRKAVDLNTLLNVVINLLEPLAKKKNLFLNNKLPKGLPLVYADEDRVQQIFHNLIGNAIKYTQKGSIEISARKGTNDIQIGVKDTGIGIDIDKIEEIFSPFEQLELPSHLTQKGTGLGLSVTKQLVEQHEGRIWLKTQLNEGSEFFFTLPRWLENRPIETPSVNAPSLPNFISAIGNNIAPTIDTNNKSRDGCCGKILIADDDPINLQVLTDILQMNSFEVVSVTNGTDAAKIALSQSFDLIILDIMMPGLSGYEVTKLVRKKLNAIELPILLLSARNQPGDVTAGFDSGANDYVTKPIERSILLSRINTMLQVGGLAEAKRQKEHALTLEQACERLGRYFPKQMVNQIITDDKENPLVAQRKQVTVLFADLAGFTSVSDRFEPEAITDILNSFLGKMGQLIEQNTGILNEILGDGIVVLFGALDNMSKAKQAVNASNLALAMQQAMEQLSQEWLDAGFDHNVKLRIGIHQDFATVGNFGSNDIVAFRAVGSGVNFAARLESYSTAGEITVSYPIYAQCKNRFNFSALEEVHFKGFNHKHRVCRLTSIK